MPGRRGRPTLAQRLALFERRERIAKMHMARLGRQQIASAMDLHVRTVDRDLDFLRKGWRKELVADLAAVRERELAELDRMEARAVEMFEATGSRDWMLVRLALKQERSKLLGLYPAHRVEVLLSHVEAERIAAEYGLDTEEVLAEAQAIIKARSRG